MVDFATKEDESAGWRVAAAWLVALSLLAAAVVFNQSAVHWRANVSDSHYYAYCGWRVSQGAVPYLDVWDNKPPGTWWVNAAGFRICGPGMEWELLICSIAVAVAIAGFVTLARTAFHRSLWPLALVTGGVLLTHLRYECGGNRTETFVVPCEILAVLGYLRWRRSGRWPWLVLGGLFAGAAPLFKQSGLAALGACAVHLALSQFAARWLSSTRVPGKRWWMPWLIGGGAAITLPAIAAIVLGAQGALREACFAVSGFNQAYFDVNDATWFNLRAAFHPYLPELTPLHGLLLLAAAGAMLGVLQLAASQWTDSVGASVFRRVPHGRVAHGFSRGGHESPVHSSPPPLKRWATQPASVGVGVLWLWLAAACYLSCVGPGRLAYHLAPTLAPLGLLALYPLHWLLRGRDLRQRIVAKPSIAAVVTVYLFVVASVAGDSVGVARRCRVTKPNWHALTRDPPAAYEVQAAEVARLTTPDETVYVWGWSPGTYRFAYRHSPSRFSTLEKLGQVGKPAEFIYDGAIADIRAAPPTLLVISVGDLQALLAPPRSEFAQWVDRHYQDRGEFEGMHILKWEE